MSGQAITTERLSTACWHWLAAQGADASPQGFGDIGSGWPGLDLAARQGVEGLHEAVRPEGERSGGDQGAAFGMMPLGFDKCGDENGTIEGVHGTRTAEKKDARHDAGGEWL